MNFIPPLGATKYNLTPSEQVVQLASFISETKLSIINTILSDMNIDEKIKVVDVSMNAYKDLQTKLEDAATLIE